MRNLRTSRFWPVVLIGVAALVGALVPYAKSQIDSAALQHRMVTASQAAQKELLRFPGVTVSFLDYQECDPASASLKPPARTRVRTLAQDGSFSEEIVHLATSDSEHEIRRADGTRIWAHDSSRVRMSVKNSGITPETTLADLPSAKAQCNRTYLGNTLFFGQDSAILGEETVLGYRVVKIFREDATMKETQWRAPELGCIELQDYWEQKDPQTGKVLSTNFVTASRVDVGPVNQSHYTKSDSYQELKPSDYTISVGRWRLQRAGASTAYLSDWERTFPAAIAQIHKQYDDQYAVSHSRLK